MVIDTLVTVTSTSDTVTVAVTAATLIPPAVGATADSDIISVATVVVAAIHLVSIERDLFFIWGTIERVRKIKQRIFVKKI